MNASDAIKAIAAIIAQVDGVTAAPAAGGINPSRMAVVAAAMHGPYAYNDSGYLSGGYVFGKTDSQPGAWIDPVVGPDCTTAVKVASGCVLSMPVPGEGSFGYLIRCSAQLGIAAKDAVAMAATYTSGPSPESLDAWANGGSAGGNFGAQYGNQ